MCNPIPARQQEAARSFTEEKGLKLSKRRFYLVTDDGFGSQFGLSFLLLVSFGMVGYSIPEVREKMQDYYFQINEWMMETAHRYAWWSLLGLLSSSCCALQLLLNAVSMGCAGFNTVIGPIRPTLLAVSLLIQISSWYVAWSRPFQWLPTLVSTLIALGLSLLPEVLSWWETSKEQTNNYDVCGQSNVHSYPVKLRMTSVGCSACLRTVSNVLGSIPSVVNYAASINENKLSIICSQDNQLKIILEKLEDAGFPMEVY